MGNQSITKIDLLISVEDSTAEELDEITRQLLYELRDLDVESVELARAGSAPEGAKIADPITIGALAIGVLPTLLPKLVEFIQAWALRGQGRTIKFKGMVAGQPIEFEGPANELQKLVTALSKSATA
jgi:hypothetical protein